MSSEEWKETPMTLISSAYQELYPKNVMSNFRVFLPHPISLPGLWEVRFLSMWYPRHIVNIDNAVIGDTHNQKEFVTEDFTGTQTKFDLNEKQDTPSEYPMTITSFSIFKGNEPHQGSYLAQINTQMTRFSIGDKSGNMDVHYIKECFDQHFKKVRVQTYRTFPSSRTLLWTFYFHEGEYFVSRFDQVLTLCANGVFNREDFMLYLQNTVVHRVNEHIRSNFPQYRDSSDSKLFGIKFPYDPNTKKTSFVITNKMDNISVSLLMSSLDTIGSDEEWSLFYFFGIQREKNDFRYQYRCESDSELVIGDRMDLKKYYGHMSGASHILPYGSLFSKIKIKVYLRWNGKVQRRNEFTIKDFTWISSYEEWGTKFFSGLLLTSIDSDRHLVLKIWDQEIGEMLVTIACPPNSFLVRSLGLEPPKYWSTDLQLFSFTITGLQYRMPNPVSDEYLNYNSIPLSEVIHTKLMDRDRYLSLSLDINRKLMTGDYGVTGLKFYFPLNGFTRRYMNYNHLFILAFKDKIDSLNLRSGGSKDRYVRFTQAQISGFKSVFNIELFPEQVNALYDSKIYEYENTVFIRLGSTKINQPDITRIFMWKSIRIQTGSYQSVQDIFRSIFSTLGEITYYEQRRDALYKRYIKWPQFISFTQDKSTRKFNATLKLNPVINYIEILLNPWLSKLLGMIHPHRKGVLYKIVLFRKTLNTNTILQFQNETVDFNVERAYRIQPKAIITGQYPVDLRGGVHTMHLYMPDLVKPSFMGHNYVPLLANIPIKAQDEEGVDDVLNYYAVPLPISRRVKVKDLDSFQVEILDHDANNIRFLSGSSPVIIEIEFQRIA